jgi:hypothetical protein
MANFIFNWAAAALQAATLDLSAGNYYAHLVTAVPVLGHSTVADLVLPTSGGYTSTPLGGLSYNATRWTFDSFNFPKYLFVSAPIGVVICKQSGGLPANTDGIICYSDFNNAIGQTILLSVGSYVVNLQFGSNGAINFSYRYQYTSGAYVNTEPVPKGLIFLIGSKNNTIAYANPFTAANSISENNNNQAVLQTERSALSGQDFSRYLAYDFGSNISIRPGTFGFWSIGDYPGVEPQLWASNTMSLTDAAVTSNINWTLLGSKVGPTNGWNFITPTNTSYWRYFKLATSNNANSMVSLKIEFYNSIALSSTVNFA